MASIDTTCTRCFRDADVEVIGKFRNGRTAIDPRCKVHTPGLWEVGNTLMLVGREPVLTYEMTGRRPISEAVS